MCFENKVLTFSDVFIKTSSFTGSGGAAEYHAVLQIVESARGDSFVKQLANINSAYFYLLSSYGHKVRPLFRRFFISDAANQSESIKASERPYPPCATSIVQQPPLDGSKIALWVYLCSDVETSGGTEELTAERNGYTHIWNAAWNIPEGNSWSQTDSLLRKYAGSLADKGCKLEDDCVRTWFFVQNVDVNYQGVVEARKALFTEHGMTPETRYITSTGIEGRQADPRASVLLDAYAVKGLEDGQQKILYAPNHMNPTHEYGVTFERGVCIDYGDRSHIFISGTASIDNKGEIVAPGDIVKQTGRMLENIEALLAEVGTGMEDVAQMIIYLRDVGDYDVVDTLLKTRFRHIPKIITLAPVCRPGWLIETECIAIRKNNATEYRNF